MCSVPFLATTESDFALFEEDTTAFPHVLHTDAKAAF